MSHKYSSMRTDHEGVCFISPEDARHWLEEEAVLIDLRRQYETAFRTPDVPEIHFIPWKTFDEHQDELPLDRPLILLDNAGVWSARLYSRILSLGVKSAAVISGGILAWADCGLPMHMDKGFALNGQCSCKLRPRKPYKERRR